MKFEEILPYFKKGLNIARKKWINSEYPHRRYIHLGYRWEQPEVKAVDKYDEYISYLDLYEIMDDDWIIVDTTGLNDEDERMQTGNERNIHIDEFLELLQDTRKKEGNIKIGVVYDITDEWNFKDKSNHSMGRWKHKKSTLYKIQLVTDELTLQEEED